MSSATHAKGTLLQREDSEGAGTYTTIPEVKDITGPALSSGEHDATSHSTAGLFKEFKAGLIDPGEIQCAINYIATNASHKLFLSDQIAFTERNYKLITTFGTFFLFRAYVKTFSPKFGTDALNAADVTLRIVQALTPPA